MSQRTKSTLLRFAKGLAATVAASALAYAGANIPEVSADLPAWAAVYLVPPLTAAILAAEKALQRWNAPAAA